MYCTHCDWVQPGIQEPLKAAEESANFHPLLHESISLDVENTLATSVQLDKGTPHTNLKLRLRTYTVLTSVSYLLTPLLLLAVYVLLVARSLMLRSHPREERTW